MKLLTSEEARSLLDYDPISGVISWKVKRRPNIYPGKQAGHKSIANGYVHICVKGRLYGAHRLAWLIFHGCFPNEQIDHINCVRHDNRIENLREIDNATNQQNQRSVRKDSKIGLKGVQKNGKGFKGVITINRVKKHLGTFRTPMEAHEAYVAAKRIFHKGNTL